MYWQVDESYSMFGLHKMCFMCFRMWKCCALKAASVSRVAPPSPRSASPMTPSSSWSSTSSPALTSPLLAHPTGRSKSYPSYFVRQYYQITGIRILWYVINRMRNMYVLFLIITQVLHEGWECPRVPDGGVVPAGGRCRPHGPPVTPGGSLPDVQEFGQLQGQA